MNIWSYIYGAAALVVVAFSLAGCRKVRTGAAIIMASWVMTNLVVIPHSPAQAFLVYFAFDFMVAEIMLFLFIHRPSVWNGTFLFAALAQLVTHLAYWMPTAGLYWPEQMSPRRYHEVLNVFYIIQCFAVIYGSRRHPSKVVIYRLGTRITKEEVVEALRRRMQA